MQSEIPRGSFVLIRETDPNRIEVGDDITFMMNATTTVTHRVIGIYENYNDSGERGFQTRGVDNRFVDEDIVQANNVIGRVQFHIPLLGAALSFVAANVWIIGGLFIGCLILLTTLKMFFSESIKERRQKKQQQLAADAAQPPLI